MARFEIGEKAVSYATEQVGELKEVALGSLSWEECLLAQELDLPSGEFSLGGMVLERMRNAGEDGQNTTSRQYLLFRGLMTWLYAPPYHSLGGRLPLMKSWDMDRVHQAYTSPKKGALLEDLHNDVRSGMGRLNEEWCDSFLGIAELITDEVDYWFLLCCARILLDKLPKEEGEMVALDENRMLQALTSTKGGSDSKKPDADPVGVRAPKVVFDDLGGYHHVKDKLKRLAKRMGDPSLGERWGTKVTKGVLLKGPRGVGKSAMAEAFAHETGLKFRSLSIADSLSKWVNQSTENIKKIFQHACTSGGMVLFFDEADAIIGGRSGDMGHREDNKVVNEFNIQMDRIMREHRVVVVLATNFPEHLDQAAIRDKRIDLVLTMDLPNESERLDIMNAIIRRTDRSTPASVFAKDLHLEEFVRRSKGLSGAALESVVDRVLASKEDADLDGLAPGPVTTQDLLGALDERLKERIAKKRVIGFDFKKSTRSDPSHDISTMLTLGAEE